MSQIDKFNKRLNKFREIRSKLTDNAIDKDLSEEIETIIKEQVSKEDEVGEKSVEIKLTKKEDILYKVCPPFLLFLSMAVESESKLDAFIKLFFPNFSFIVSIVSLICSSLSVSSKF